MKMLISTNKLRQGVIALVFALAALLTAGQAKACSASFTDSVSGKTVKFYNSSTGTSVSYIWSFGDGTSTTTTSTATQTHTYADYSKSYTICLYIRDSLGCRDTLCKTVTTGKSPCSVGLVNSISGLNVTYSDSGSSAAVAGHARSVTWSFGDGNTGSGSFTKHTYAKNGSYTECITVYDSVTGCTAKGCKTITINNCTLTAVIGYTVSGYSVTFTATTAASKHSKYLWYFGDGVSDSTSGATTKHTYKGGSSWYSYLYVYDSTTGCFATCSQTVIICNVKPGYNFTATGLSVSFRADSSNPASVKYSWDFGDKTTSKDKNPKHVFSATGTYHVCITCTDSIKGCSDQFCYDVYVNGCTLTASFTYTISGSKVTYTATTNSTSKHMRYYWVFGDGSKDSTTGSTVSHTYSSTASVGVGVSVYDSTTKCTAGHSIKLYFCNLKANFTANISGANVKLDADSTGTFSTKYTWSLGDGTSATGKNISYTYKKNGSFTVCLYVNDSTTGCKETLCKTVVINSCTITTSYTYTVKNQTVSFTGSGSVTTHVRYKWFFGDGATDSTSGKTVSHKYSSSTKSVTAYLQMYDSVSKCTVYYYHTIYFCSVSGTFTFTATGKTLKFESNKANASSAKYKWSFGDGTTSTDPKPSHTFSKDGYYHVCLTATDSPCTDTWCDSIKVISTYCIHGTVSAGKGTGFPCIVYLIVYNSKDSSLKALDSTSADSAGKYEFCGLSNGTYYTKAALTSKHPYYKNFLPTYHSKATKWAKAKSVVINNADETGVDIDMEKGTNPGGAGFVGGKIKAGANKTGDPVANVEVVLYDANDVAVAYTLSDANGDYKFAGIAFGTYTIEVEMLGKPCTPATVVLSDTSATKIDVNMLINTTSIVPEVGTSGIKPGAWTISAANVYPNPVNNTLYISTNLANNQDVNIRIYDLTGKVVTEMNTNIAAGQQNTQVDASTLPQGMYFIKLQLQKENRIMESRFVKVN